MELENLKESRKRREQQQKEMTEGIIKIILSGNVDHILAGQLIHEVIEKGQNEKS